MVQIGACFCGRCALVAPHGRAGVARSFLAARVRAQPALVHPRYAWLAPIDVTAEHEALQQSLQSQYEASEKKMKDVKATSGKEIKLIKAALQPKPAAAPKDEA